jgi:hypothetical protein
MDDDQYRQFLYKLVESAIKRLPLLAQALLWVFLFLLSVSNIIGSSIAAFVAAVPYPFIDRRRYPPMLANLIDERRSIPGRITPALAIEISKGMAIITALSLTAAIVEPIWIFFPPMTALYMVAVIIIRQMRIVRLGYE